METETKTPLDRAIDAAGGITKMARAMNLKGHAVIQQWRLTRVPAEHCPAIERLTRGIVRCEELRPDMDWGVIVERAKAAPAPAAETTEQGV